MLLTGIKLKDVEILETHHAILTEAGWVIPEWLVYLRAEVVKRDSTVYRHSPEYLHARFRKAVNAYLDK